MFIEFTTEFEIIFRTTELGHVRYMTVLLVLFYVGNFNFLIFNETNFIRK